MESKESDLFFETQIQALYGSIWVPIRRNCYIKLVFAEMVLYGEPPVFEAMLTIANTHGIAGNYGRHLKTCPWDGSRRINAIRFYRSNQNAAPERAKESKDDHKEGDECFYYYSMKEFAIFISEVKNIESNMDAMFERA